MNYGLFLSVEMTRCFMFLYLLKVNKGVEASLVQLLETGLLHADPHPGNLRYTSNGCIGLVQVHSPLIQLPLSKSGGRCNGLSISQLKIKMSS